ncbi:MAG TPA: hypothetical protein VLH08_10890 [Acidobacteriota bacterium]|nr:hypothetical protein [Acidobacteriota bacterium]
MSNPVGATKVNGTPQLPPSTPQTSQVKTPVDQKQASAATPMSDEAKTSMKVMHQLDGTAKEAKLRASMNPLADPTKDGRRDWVKKMIKDGTLDAKEAQNVVNIAKDDAKLSPAEKDPKKLEPALINVYVRAGVPVDEARRLAGKTIELSNNGKGSESVSTQGPEKMTDEKRAKIRAEGEDGAKANTAANKQWTVDEIKKDRAGFMRNVVQMDGDRKTDADYKSCATTSFMGGIILSKPEAAQDLAKKLQSEKGKKEFPKLQEDPAKTAVERMASGNFSPKDVSVVSNALYESSRYMKADGTMSEGVPITNQMALIGRMKNIGFNPPMMRQDTFGTANRKQGTHVMAFANNTGFDPWPYPGSNGQSVITDGDTASRNQALVVGDRLGIPNQKRVMLERMEQDGNGGIILERHAADGKEINPPLKARYTFNSAENRWERDPAVKVTAGQEQNLPQYIPVEHDKRRDMKMEKE